MIKRAGVEVSTPRTKNVSIAKSTLSILENKGYVSRNGSLVDLKEVLDAAVEGTEYYPAGTEFETKASHIFPFIEVVNETTAQAAVRLQAAGKENIVALNFASARNQCGGWLQGAQAQEEDLARCSGLYACVKKKPLFYNANILCDDTFYTDGIIYSPKVPFFRDEYLLLLEEPFLLSLITAPAPNVSSLTKLGTLDKELQEAVFIIRATKVLQVAAKHGHKNIILGAWGCGAFGNDPEVVTQAFIHALRAVPQFNHVCFAVYDTREPPVLFETFQRNMK